MAGRFLVFLGGTNAKPQIENLAQGQFNTNFISTRTCVLRHLTWFSTVCQCQNGRWAYMGQERKGNMKNKEIGKNNSSKINKITSTQSMSKDKTTDFKTHSCPLSIGQTVQDLIIRCVLRHLIWFCTVFQCPIK